MRCSNCIWAACAIPVLKHCCVCNKRKWQLKNVCVCFLCGIRLHQGPVLCSDITLATRIARVILSSGMYCIPSIDITASKSELSEPWYVWQPGFSYFTKGKANVKNATRKKRGLLYRAGSRVQDILENLAIVPPPKARRVITFISKPFEHRTFHFKCKKMLRTKGMFLASYAENPERMSTHLCFDFANKQGNVAIGKRDLNSPLEISCWGKTLPWNYGPSWAWEKARRQASSIAEGERRQSNANTVIARNPCGSSKHRCYACSKAC